MISDIPDFNQWKMKSVGIGLGLLMFICQASAQSDNVAGHVIEGGKLVKALTSKKDNDRNGGCKSGHADFCVINESASTIQVSLYHRASEEKREMVIQPALRECSLQASVGVWTYDLRISGHTMPIRKGDLLLESCQNLTMNIKY